jgi:hypothetical protein
MVDRRMKRTAQALYAVLIPVTFSTIGKEAVRITLASTRAALRGGPSRRSRHQASGGTPRMMRQHVAAQQDAPAPLTDTSTADADDLRPGANGAVVPVTLRSSR